jgi:putative transposase
VGTRTSGSAGGSEQTTARKRGTAARSRPLIQTVKRTSRNVKRWQNGDMCLRWTAAGMLEAKAQFRRVIGYPKLPALAVAVERDIAHHTITDTAAPEVAPTAV